MALTPTSEALNRATPGFDALVGVLENTTNRILRNKQFAKEVQARKDFAKFQSDLQLENRLEVMRASGEQQKEFFDYQRQQELGEDGYLAEELDIQTDARIEEQRRLTEQEIDLMPQMTQAEIDSQNAITQGTREQRQIDTRFKTDEQIRAAEGSYAARQQYSTADVSIPEVNRKHTLNLNSRIPQSLRENDPDFQYRQPQYTQGPDGNLAIQPVSVDIDGDGEEENISWSDYENVYVETMKERHNQLREIETALESNNLQTTSVEGQLGRRRLEEIRAELKNKSNIYEIDSYLNDIKGWSPNTQSTSESEAFLTIQENTSTLRPFLDPFSPQYLDKEERFDYEKYLGTTTNDPRYDRMITDVENYVERMEFSNLYSQLDVETLNDESLVEQLKDLQQAFGVAGNVPSGYRNLVFNWNYDPNVAPQGSNKLFLTKQEAKKQLIKQLTATPQDADIQKAQNAMTPTMQEFIRKNNLLNRN